MKPLHALPGRCSCTRLSVSSRVPLPDPAHGVVGHSQAELIALDLRAQTRRHIHEAIAHTIVSLQNPQPTAPTLLPPDFFATDHSQVHILMFAKAERAAFSAPVLNLQTADSADQ
jgi:hypothetical protein